MTVNGWIILQQRINLNSSFDQLWQAYKDGFGSLGSDYWLGNENVHLLTSSGKYKLRFEMLSAVVGWVSAEYDSFQLDSEAGLYKIHVDGYSGDAGDGMEMSGVYSRYCHNGMNFTTIDSVHDGTIGTPTQNCSVQRGGGWWYNDCFMVCLNGHATYAFSWWPSITASTLST